MNDHMGEWAIRVPEEAQGNLWAGSVTSRGHLVESRIGDRFVMNCGRQLPLESSLGELRFSQLLQDDLKCKQCL
jgi:hypothetical protein